MPQSLTLGPAFSCSSTFFSNAFEVLLQMHPMTKCLPVPFFLLCLSEWVALHTMSMPTFLAARRMVLRTLLMFSHNGLQMEGGRTTPGTDSPGWLWREESSHFRKASMMSISGWPCWFGIKIGGTQTRNQWEDEQHWAC